MEKEFVRYDEALALKELGFDEPCFGYYIGGDWDHDEYDMTLQFKIDLSKGNYLLDDKKCTAPTFSQAFRFFREKYNLKGYISPVEYLDDTADTYHWCVYDKCNSGYDQLTYEEAELECLKKLIEIVKEKEKK